jgi:hypothetical protein
MEAGRQDASLLMIKHRGLGSAEEWAVFCVLIRECVEARESP